MAELRIRLAPRSRHVAILRVVLAVWLLCAALPPSALATAQCEQPNPSGCLLDFGAPVSAVISAPNEAHIWRISLNRSGFFAVMLTNLPAAYRLYVYGPDRALIAQSSNPGAQNELVEVAVAAPGEYQVFVDSPLGETSPDPYLLIAAREIAIGEVVTGSILNDLLAFNLWLLDVPEGAEFRIVLSNLQSDYDLLLLGLDGTTIASSERPGTAEDMIEVTGLAPGRYAIGVVAFESASSQPYRLSVIPGLAPPAASVPTAEVVAPVPTLAPPPPAPTPPTAAPPTSVPPTSPPPAGALSEADIAARVGPSVVLIDTPDGRGSGVRVQEGILTNSHVVGGRGQVQVLTADGRRGTAVPVKCDPRSDLTLLQTDLSLPPIELEPARSHRQGDQVLVLGYPLSYTLGEPISLTRGLVSAIRVDDRNTVFVQTDAAMNPGNSGGALLNARGRMIGMPFAALRGAQGVNFALGTETIQGFLAGPGSPCPSVSPPGTVLLSDNFQDRVAGMLPLSSSTQGITRGYVEGEYQLHQTDPNYLGAPIAFVPGDFRDASIAVDARIVGTVSGRQIFIGCRDPDGSGGYALLLEPGNTRGSIVRFDSTGLTALTDWRGSPNQINPGIQSNRLELSCVGSTITASVNGRELVSVRDTTYSGGQMFIGSYVTTFSTIEVRFDNLVVTQR